MSGEAGFGISPASRDSANASRASARRERLLLASMREYGDCWTESSADPMRSSSPARPSRARSAARLAAARIFAVSSGLAATSLRSKVARLSSSTSTRASSTSTLVSSNGTSSPMTFSSPRSATVIKRRRSLSVSALNPASYFAAADSRFPIRRSIKPRKASRSTHSLVRGMSCGSRPRGLRLFSSGSDSASACRYCPAKNMVTSFAAGSTDASVA